MLDKIVNIDLLETSFDVDEQANKYESNDISNDEIEHLSAW